MKFYERIRENIKEAIENVRDENPLDLGENEEVKLEDNSYITSLVINTRKLSEMDNKKLEDIFRLNVINIFKDKNKQASLPMGYKIEDKQIEIIFITEKREDIYPCFDAAVSISTFIDLFNRLIVENGLEEIEVGIGIASSERLELKYADRDLKKREILSHKEISTKASRIALLGDVGREKRLNIAYVVYENILRKLIDEKGNRVRSEFDEKFNMTQGTYFATDIKDEEFKKAIEEK